MRKILLTYILLCLGMAISAQQIRIPWSCGFEEDETAEISQWVLNPGTSDAADQWTIGNAVRSVRKQSLYISSDGGVTASFGKKRDIVMAYRLINLPEQAKEYDLSFDYRQPSDKGVLYVFFDYSSSLIYGTDEYQLLQYANTSRADGIPTRVLEKARYVTTKLPSTNASRTQEMKKTNGWTNVSIDAGPGTNYSDRFTTNTSKRQLALVFVWVNKNGQDTIGMGACIDNIQIASATVAKPTDVQATHLCADSSITLSWNSGLDGYMVGYRKSTSGSWRTFTYQGSVAPRRLSYTVTGLKDGVYDFRVCGWKNVYNSTTQKWVTDTTGYVSVSNYLLYCPENQCINFADLDNAVCTYGPEGAIDRYQHKIDHGWEDVLSLHTVNTDQEAYDIRGYDPATGERLKIIPENAMVSVRLGNWYDPSTNASHPDNKAQSDPNASGKMINGETITYDFVVDSANSAILILRYAMVFDAYTNPNHSEAESPYFKLSILDEHYNTIDGLCGVQYFYCPAVTTSTPEAEEDRLRRIREEHWHVYHSEDFPVINKELGFVSGCDIWWKNWSTMGLNLSEYDGKLLHVVIEVQGCTQSAHFGYGYFTLGCASATIETEQCGETPTATADAPAGFDYQWYAEKDTTYFRQGMLKDPIDGHTIVVSRTDELTVNAGDAQVYICHLSYLDSPDCFFELSTRLMPRNPNPLHTYTLSAAQCKSLLALRDSSQVISYDNDGNVVILAQGVDYSQWEIRSLTTGNKTSFSGTEFTYEGAVSGDTVVVTHTAYISDGECANVLKDTVIMPDITTPDSLIFDTICDNYRYTFGGQKYNETGIYYDSLINRFGCDSVEILHLQVNPTNMMNRADTICSTQLPYVFNGIYKGEQKRYEFTSDKNYITSDNYVIKLDNRYQCDSVINLELTIIPYLKARVDSIPILCSDEGGFSLSYQVTEGDFDSLKITFSPEALNAGWHDTTIYHDPYTQPVIPPTTRQLDYPYGDTLLPNMYYMYVQFFQHRVCNYRRIDTIPIDVRYANSIIVQKWNDVLALLDEKHNVNHCTFSSYQWYKNNEPIEGATKPYLYTGENLDFTADYSVLLTRTGDTIQQFTCTFRPEQRDIPGNATYPTIVAAGSQIRSRLDAAATVSFHTMTGAVYSIASLPAGESTFAAPRTPGYYILSVQSENGEAVRQKILITP